MGNIFHQPSITVPDMTTLNTTEVQAGSIITVSNVGGGNYATFLFPTSGLGNQTNRTLVSTDQTMSASNYSSNVSSDMSSVSTDYTVHSATFTAPIGVTRGDVTTWAVAADESGTAVSQLIRMHFEVVRVSTGDIIFDPDARPRASIAPVASGSVNIVNKRSVFLSLTDTEIEVNGGEDYRVDVIMSKEFLTGPTKFREGLIKINWRA